MALYILPTNLAIPLSHLLCLSLDLLFSDISRSHSRHGFLKLPIQMCNSSSELQINYFEQGI